jgi:hypothetical protein
VGVAMIALVVLFIIPNPIAELGDMSFLGAAP